ncbi:MAG TPA: transcription-repair coupling factor, partial [Bacteroidales bacterium]|nr:transcription-repair coupling factor [Bacteroidales bacterium]
AARRLNLPFFFIGKDKEEAAYFYNDLQNLMGTDRVYFFSSTYKRSIQFGQEDPTNIILRTEVLNALRSAGSPIVVSYPEAIIEKVAARKQIEQNTLEIHQGEKISSDFLNDVLFEYQFEQVDFVYEPGQFSVRGSIVDIFSFSDDHPYRIDFFGEEVESIRTFDVENQLSLQKMNKATIQPRLYNGDPGSSQWQSLFDFMDEHTLLCFNDYKYLKDRLAEIFDKTLENNPDKQIESYTISPVQFEAGMESFRKIECGHRSEFAQAETLQIEASPPPAFNKNFNLLSENLLQNQQQGYFNYISSDNEKQIERLESIFQDINPQVQFTPVMKTLHEGFIDHHLKMCLYTDHQIFGRYHKFQIKSGFSKKERLNIEELNNLHPGDYVVHVDHGIGKFGGLEKIEVNGKTQEAVRLIYKDNDILYVNIHSLHKISKYKSKDLQPPKIYKLGSAAWKNLKNKTKKKVKDIAKELIQLYAQRMEKAGYSFTDDTYLQQELESSFIYEDTPDQLAATKAVKQDMESSTPMDRLVCGDVGFGKTEIAIRAAFKAVADSKQVAILVPTTILALQHYQTFTDRLRDFPANVEHISRLRSHKKQREVKDKLAQGQVDIIIGTHRLIGKDIQFKDLGLLIVDEEQKFGVQVKEKLKNIKLNVDTLTLTATPIPRTLQFSLMGARDMSIIHTPPPNRYPIVTEVHPFNEDIIREAIEYEFERDGQVFFINNRIQNIHELEKLINRMLPNVRTVVAHGQMEGAKLEKIMLDFIHHEYDVLIATTIIESGLDIPNTNTMIINEAQNFGLSDLHQLRGRVGRSNKKAFCYLLAPPMTAVTEEARRRLNAIEEFSELGSGFNIAMQDLDIRGAGNLLGKEQSGFIADIGFETYQRILNEALQELKENEFQNLYQQEKKQTLEKQKQEQRFLYDCQIETDLQILFPDDYIPNISERINLYRELDSIDDEQKLEHFEEKLRDRFGPLPEATQELLNVVRMRWHAIALGFEKVVIKNNTMVIHFISNQDSPYYQSGIFSGILHYVQRKPRQFQLKEGKKLTMTLDQINNINKALRILQKMRENL